MILQRPRRWIFCQFHNFYHFLPSICKQKEAGKRNTCYLLFISLIGKLNIKRKQHWNTLSKTSDSLILHLKVFPHLSKVTKHKKIKNYSRENMKTTKLEGKSSCWMMLMGYMRILLWIIKSCIHIYTMSQKVRRYITKQKCFRNTPFLEII